MYKKLIQASSALLLVCFSFFYTEKCVDFVRQSDPIMKEIVNVAKEYEITSSNATINDHTITPGVNGLKINVNESFNKMKQYGEFNENLLVFEEVSPTISIDDYYDYYISSGNALSKNVSLVFKVDSTTYLNDVLKVLKEQNARGTFFIDGKIIKENPSVVEEVAKDYHEVELLSYDGLYDPLTFKDSLKTLEMLSNVKGKYCYAEYDNKDVLDVCGNLKMHTVVPTILAKSYPYNTVKTKLASGSIIGLPVSKTVAQELPTIVNYITQKGYVMDTLDSVLSEAREIEK